MNEAFISYLWKYRRLSNDLFTEAGDQLIVLHPGDQNTDGGPDFFNARLRIGTTTWAGNVEIHVRSSDWYRHGHQHDQAYRNAVLHVVYEDDHPVTFSDGTALQTLAVKDRFSTRILERFTQMQSAAQWIPCYNQLAAQPTIGFDLWAPALAVERLTDKSEYIRKLWESCLCNWDEAFYRHLAWCFGFRINNVAFELLAKSLPLKVIRKYTESQFRLEALLLGHAGMLRDDYFDDYPKELLREYLYLRGKHNLEPFSGISWKFLRMRPSNFPTVRISQWASFLHQSEGRFFHLLEHGNIPEIFRHSNIQASEYWNAHYLFDKPSVFSRKVLGQVSINLLIINGIAPFMFFYGYEKDLPVFREKALGFLEQTDHEVNTITAKWQEIGLPCNNALHSQALIQLKRNYCDRKRCLECRIGSELLTEEGL